ncbi:MAG: YraN family protein [Rhodothermales bacterium]
MSTKRTGDRGEQIAAAYLERKGYTILERNYRFERAEVDLICFKPDSTSQERGELVFTEVKTRTGLRFGRPEEAVTDEKKRHLTRAASAYLYEHKRDGSPCRFDVISIVLRPGHPPDIEHFENAFWAL